jgi:hypothetical protein
MAFKILINIVRNMPVQETTPWAVKMRAVTFVFLVLPSPECRIIA